MASSLARSTTARLVHPLFTLPSSKVWLTQNLHLQEGGTEFIAQATSPTCDNTDLSEDASILVANDRTQSRQTLFSKENCGSIRGSLVGGLHRGRRVEKALASLWTCMMQQKREDVV